MRSSSGAASLLDPTRLAAVEQAAKSLAGQHTAVEALVRLAAELVEAPAAAITLVGAEDRVASGYGLSDGGLGPSLYPFCRRVVRSGRSVVVREVPSRTLAGNRGVRAYLGVPLKGPGGARVGALCATSPVARDWTRQQVATVRRIATALSQVEPPPPSRVTRTVNRPVDVETILTTIVEAYIAVALDGTIVSWNAAAAGLLGWNLAQVLGEPFVDLLIDEPDQAPVRAIFAQLPSDRSGQARRRQVWARHQDGQRVPVELTATINEGQLGKLITVTMLDTTARLAADADAARQERSLAAVLDSIDAGVLAIDLSGRVLFVNHVMQSVHGVGPTWRIDDSHPEVGYPGGPPADSAEALLRRALGGERLREVDIRVLPPGPTTGTFAVNAEPIVQDGTQLGVVIVLNDVTEQRRIEQAQRCEKAVAVALVDASSVEDTGQRVVTALGQSLEWAATELWLADEVTDALRPVAAWTRENITPAPLGWADAVARDALREGRPRWVADPRIAARPDIRTAVAVPIRMPERTIGVLTLFSTEHEDGDEILSGMLTRVAGQIGQYRERRRSEELALELARTKDDFLALVGHEMRTPLTSIASYTELLRDDPGSWATHGAQLLEVIHRNTETLSAIINDLLDLAGLTSGHVSIRPRPMDLVEVVHDALDGVRAAAAERRITLAAELPAAAGLTADPQRMRQVLNNLLSNAVKYSVEGGTVRVVLKSDGDALVLCVSDAGIGIPPEERDRLFQRFFRSSSAQERGIPGTGLGLVTTKAICEQHGGTITAHHDEPGTTMTVRLPVG